MVGTLMWKNWIQLGVQNGIATLKNENGDGL
jgi:hypothetical protein